MPFDKEAPGFNPDEKHEQPKPHESSGLTLADAKNYLLAHLHEPGLEDDGQVVKWGPAEALHYFETRCNYLRESGSPELYKVRQLTHLIDKETRSGGYVNANKREVALLLMNYAADELRLSPEEDSIGKQEAGAEYDARIAAVRGFEHINTIEPVLAIVEESVAKLDKKIDDINKEPNKFPRDEKKHRAEVSALNNKREVYRRARIFLMDEYFPK